MESPSSNDWLWSVALIVWVLVLIVAFAPPQ